MSKYKEKLRNDSRQFLSDAKHILGEDIFEETYSLAFAYGIATAEDRNVFDGAYRERIIRQCGITPSVEDTWQEALVSEAIFNSRYGWD